MTTPFDLEAFQAKMAEIAGTAASKAVQTAEKEKADRLAAEKAAADKDAAEKARIELVASASAKALVTDLETSMKGGFEEFAKALASVQEQVVAKSEEVSQLLAARSGFPAVSDLARASKGMPSKAQEQEIDEIVILGMCKKLPMFETDFGRNHMATSETFKAVNTSSDVDVSSASYETIFSTNLLRDIQKNLIIAPLFDEITMAAATLTIPVQPDYGSATWVNAQEEITANDNANFVKRTGNRQNFVLTEITLKTFKLAAKAYMTEDTSEDAIIAVVPLIRRYIAESHANTIEDSMVAKTTAANTPKSLVIFADEAETALAGTGRHVLSRAARTSLKVEAKDILLARRKLGKYGMRNGDLAVIVSMKVHYDLMEDTAWQDMTQVGASATKLTGMVGMVYGLPIIVSDKLDDVTTDGSVPFLIVNKTNFVVTRQRGMTVRTQFEPELDAEVIVATQRRGFEQYFAKKGVVACKWAA